MAFQSVKINDQDMYSVYGCILASKTLNPPEVQTKYVDVPLRDGSIDLTEELTSSPKYKSRQISMSFLYLGDNKAEKISEIETAFHGKRLHILFDDDPSFYYEGRIAVNKVASKNQAQYITLVAECDPFKYDINESDMDWEWDTFDFEYGIINEAGQIVVSGDTDFTLICRRDREFPTFTASTAMTMTFKGQTYNLKQGAQKLYRVFFEKGENEMRFSGNGTVSIKYIGGTL